MIPFMKRKVYQRLLMFCVGLAVSAMASTGTMILLPEVPYCFSLTPLRRNKIENGVLTCTNRLLISSVR